MISDEASRTSKSAKKLILKGDRSLDALFSRYCKKFKVFWTPKEPGYLMEQIGVKDDLRNVQNCNNNKKGILKGDGSLDALFSRL